MKNLELLNKYDYDKTPTFADTNWNKTFSVGIFQWELKSNKKALKKGKIIIRICGEVANKEQVFAKAAEIANQLNNGISINAYPKKIVVCTLNVKD